MSVANRTVFDLNNLGTLSPESSNSINSKDSDDNDDSDSSTGVDSEITATGAGITTGINTQTGSKFGQ